MKPKYRSYDRQAAPPVSEYRGLSESEKDWLRKFNTEFTNSDKVERPIFNDAQRRESYRSRYHRRMDAMVQAIYQPPRAEYDPTTTIEEMIDRHDRLQRILKNKIKK